MNYHPALAKGSGIVPNRRASIKPKERMPRKEVSRLWRTGHKSYPVEPLANPEDEEE